MNQPRVVVVGSVNVDLVVRLPRLPRPGETAGGGVFAVHPGGKGGNQAVAAARLGADVSIRSPRSATTTTAGGPGRTSSVRASAPGSSAPCPTATGVAVVLVDETAENLIALAPGANAALRPDVVTAALTALPDGPAVVLASLEVPLACVEAAVAVAADRGWTVVVNPAPAVPLPETLLGRIDVLTPNEGELRVLADAGAAALLDAGVGAVVVTRGAAGAVVHDGRQELVVPSPPVEAVDTTGAGDCFSGALAWALGSGLALPDAVRLAVDRRVAVDPRLGRPDGLSHPAGARRAPRAGGRAFRLEAHCVDEFLSTPSLSCGHFWWWLASPEFVGGGL